MKQSKKNGFSIDLHSKLDIPKELRVLPVSIRRANFMYDLICKHKLKSTLEVGFGLGVSSAYIMSASKSAHIAIDPFVKTNWDSSIGVNNLKKLGLKKLLKLYIDYSHNVLPKLLNKGTKLDFAFIDGDHKYDCIFVDFYYIDLMLKKNGFILFDDAGMRTTQLVASFIRTNKENYVEVKTNEKGYLLFQKKSLVDKRPWYHFNEFHNTRGISSHAKFKEFDLMKK